MADIIRIDEKIYFYFGLSPQPEDFEKIIFEITKGHQRSIIINSNCGR